MNILFGLLFAISGLANAGGYINNPTVDGSTITPASASFGTLPNVSTFTSSGNLQLVSGSTLTSTGGISISTAGSAELTDYRNKLRFDSTELSIWRNTNPGISFYRANGTQSLNLNSNGGTVSLLAIEASAPVVIDNPGQSQAIRIDAEGSVCINCTDSQASLHVVSTNNAVGADIFRVDSPYPERLFAIKSDTTVFIVGGSTWNFSGSVVFSTAASAALTSNAGNNIVLNQNNVSIPQELTLSSGVVLANGTGNYKAGALSYDQTGTNLVLGLGASSATITAGVWSAWTPTFGGFSAAPTVLSRFAVIGKTVFVLVDTTANGTSNATNFTFTLPYASKSDTSASGVGNCRDNNTLNTCSVALTAASATATMQYGPTLAAWTSSGNKSVYIQFTYEAN